MAHDGGETYPLAYQAVQEMAPNASGVYTIYTSQRWVHVGESDDIRQSLFRHLNDPPACMARYGPLSFSFETVPMAERVSHQQALVAALKPACNAAHG
ncbi:MAG TPA: hypothetical protein VNZ26_21715 [Vicinamibacterales bacterium]|jgi:hypothetical protein|nr:hypothetical protein [Vicinamibacterales bacterium]